MNAQHTVRMILPGLRLQSYDEIRDEIFRRITERHGGVTTWCGWGWSKSEADHNTEGLVHESIVICECAVSSWNTEDRHFWIDLAHYARKHLHQEAIMLSVYGHVISILIDSEFPEDVNDHHGSRLEDPNQKEKKQ